MKKTLLGFCLLAGMTAQVGAQGLDLPAGASASRWSSSVMERHMPVDAAQLQKLSQKKFRYMDMAQGKRSKSIRNAVIVRGGGEEGRGDLLQPQTYREHERPARPNRRIVIMQPMT
ncbi:hypothetical protein J8I26_17565 [Herbaspirillum sp. LeCh32-8]|uniref:hypothetical protein n=1 Tax=Herbaspirillum sp. LeCh32-8 TaxID=2821356 RepID=UPI001AEAF67B|nr:hypothetical protein [Herbaspirillum sp. LeCh32-8]MBP0599922.1 hypothetical protein [Herbaspirillum sp. LeCh32-8]